VDGATPALHLLDVAEAVAVVSAGVVATVDPGHPRKGSEELSERIEDLGAPSGARIHHHHQAEAGSAAQLLMREAHERGAAHPQGIVHRATGQSTAGAQRLGAGALWMTTVEERAHRGTARLKKTDTAVALAPLLGIVGAALMMMKITMGLPGAVNLLKNRSMLSH